MKYKIKIHNIEANINLGISKEEQAQKQNILINCEILFAQKPQACNDDNILHTLCYATIYQKIINFCNKAEVKTLEFLTNQLWEFLQNNYKQASFNIEVVKLNPPINGHQKPISFAIESF